MVVDFNSKREKICTNLSRDQFRTLAGFLTGHFGLGEHLKKIGLTNQNECRLSNDVEKESSIGL